MPLQSPETVRIKLILLIWKITSAILFETEILSLYYFIFLLLSPFGVVTLFKTWRITLRLTSVRWRQSSWPTTWWWSSCPSAFLWSSSEQLSDEARCSSWRDRGTRREPRPPRSSSSLWRGNSRRPFASSVPHGVGCGRFRQTEELGCSGRAGFASPSSTWSRSRIRTEWTKCLYYLPLFLFMFYFFLTCFDIGDENVFAFYIIPPDLEIWAMAFSLAINWNSWKQKQLWTLTETHNVVFFIPDW